MRPAPGILPLVASLLFGVAGAARGQASAADTTPAPVRRVLERSLFGLRPWPETRAPSAGSKDAGELRFVSIDAHGSAASTTVGANDPAPATTTIGVQFEDARVYVPVTVVGDTVRWFILDTGAQPTLLDNAVAKAAGVRATASTHTTGAGGGEVAITRASDVVLDVGSVRVGPLPVNIAPLDSLLGPSTGRRMPGIVGSRFFRDHVVELDVATSELRIHDPETFDYHGPGAVIALDLQSDIPFASGWIALPDGRHASARMLVDLGAKATLLVTEHFAERFGLANAFDRSVVSEFGAGMGGATHYRFGRVPAIGLGDDRRTQRDSAIIGLSVGRTLTSDRYDALIGADYLARFRVIFDYRRNRLILEPRTSARSISDFDMSGLFVTTPDPQRRRLEVSSVRSGSPADRAGVLVGDVIGAVDDVRAPELTLARLRERLRAGDGQSVGMTIRRGSAMLHLDVVLRRVI